MGVPQGLSKSSPQNFYSCYNSDTGLSQVLNPTKLQTDSTGFTLESVIHIGYEPAITTTINLRGLFFSSLDSLIFTKLSNKFYCFSGRAGSAIRSSLKDTLENKFSRVSNSHRLLVAIVVIIESKGLFLQSLRGNQNFVSAQIKFLASQKEDRIRLFSAC